jgi:hypothetical protein
MIKQGRNRFSSLSSWVTGFRVETCEFGRAVSVMKIEGFVIHRTHGVLPGVLRRAKQTGGVQ